MARARVRGATWLAVAATLALAFVLVGCAPKVTGSVIPTAAPTGRHVAARSVRVSLLTVPPGARVLGMVQADAINGTIEVAMHEFRDKVAVLGGNFGKVDDVTTRFDYQPFTTTDSYKCPGGTCTDRAQEMADIPVTRIIGRAFEVRP